MQFITTVIVGEGDAFLYTADAAAAQVLAALGGNSTKDYSQVTIQQNAQGSAGVTPVVDLIPGVNAPVPPGPL